jgi:hypothetical protein
LKQIREQERIGDHQDHDLWGRGKREREMEMEGNRNASIIIPKGSPFSHWALMRSYNFYELWR